MLSPGTGNAIETINNCQVLILILFNRASDMADCLWRAHGIRDLLERRIFWKTLLLKS